MTDALKMEWGEPARQSGCQSLPIYLYLSAASWLKKGCIMVYLNNWTTANIENLKFCRDIFRENLGTVTQMYHYNQKKWAILNP